MRLTTSSFGGWHFAILALLLMTTVAAPAMAGEVTVYVADAWDNAVKQILPDGTTQAMVGVFNEPHSVAVDAQGNVYYANYGVGLIEKISASDGSITTLGYGFKFSAPNGVAVDAQGNVYVADSSAPMVYRINAADESVVPVGGGYSFYEPYGVAVDSQNNVYFTEPFHSAVLKISASDGSVTPVNGGFMMPFGVEADIQGNVYVTDMGTNDVKKIRSDGTIEPLGNGFAFSSPAGIDIDAQGNVYVADMNNMAVRKILADGTVVTIGSVVGPFDVAVYEEADEPIATPEFPSTALPAVLVIGLLGTVLLIRRTKDH